MSVTQTFWAGLLLLIAGCGDAIIPPTTPPAVAEQLEDAGDVEEEMLEWTLDDEEECDGGRCEKACDDE